MKYAFFIETQTKLTGEQVIIKNIASAIAESVTPDDTVYYINNTFADDLKGISPKVQIEDINQFDFSRLEGATVFMPINYLFYFIARVYKKIKVAKILLLSYDDLTLKKLFAQNKNKISIESFLSLIKDNKAVAFSNRIHYYNNCISYGMFDLQYMPLVCPDTSIRLKKSDRISDNELNIGIVIPFNSSSMLTIRNLCERLLKLEWTDKKINLHLIGKGNSLWTLNFSKFSNRIRFVCPGDLTGNQLQKYLTENVDVVLSSGINAMYTAMCGLPTVIPIEEDKNSVGDKYIWFYDIKDYVFRLNRNQMLFLNNNYETISSILYSIYKQEKKLEIGNLCRDKYMLNCSNQFAVEQFKLFEQNCTLSYRDCIIDPFVKSQIGSFLEAKNLNPELRYGDYYESGYNLGQKSKKSANNSKTVELTSGSKFAYLKVQRSYKKKERNIKKIFEKNKKIKVGFIVVFNSVFPTRPIFEKMINDKNFDPYIIVAPNISRSFKYQIDTYNEAYDSLYSQYGDRVINGYKYDEDEYLELNDEFNIIFFSNPYKHLVHPNHHIEYFLNKNVLPIYSSYGFAALKFWDEVISTDFYNYLWRACVETPSNLKHLQKEQKIKGKNGVVTGYIKVDKLALIAPTHRERKRILICPHHTVWGWKNLNIGNFLKYSELFVQLPKLFPDIDFVFRPHPLLIANLKDHKVWTEQQINLYFERLLANSNMVYDTSGDYFQQFVDSDAMIHDCGSFIGEYLYTEKPCCYMMKSKDETYRGLVPLGQQCMDQYYHAFEEKDIIDFIQNVVINGVDPLKTQRENFARQELKVNYPHASDVVIEKIKEALKIKS